MASRLVKILRPIANNLTKSQVFQKPAVVTGIKTYSTETKPTVRPVTDPVKTNRLADFGTYVAEVLPKYVQKVQISHGDELEILVHPDGIVPTISFLKDHHHAQFLNMTDITAIDVPSREYRFEVRQAISVYIAFRMPRSALFDSAESIGQDQTAQRM